MNQNIIFFFTFFLVFQLKAQKFDHIPAMEGYAKPVGGFDYLKDYIKDELVYPNEQYTNDTEGEVYLKYIINNDGSIAAFEVANATNDAFKKEAIRFFKQIVWEEDFSRLVRADKYDAIRIIFSPKVYKRALKSRNYDQLPFPTDKAVDSTQKVYKSQNLDSLPQLIGAKNMNEFAANHFKYPEVALQRKIGGTVKIKFVVEAYGYPTNFEIAQAVPAGCNEEAMRILKMMRWKPAVKDGKYVRTKNEFILIFAAPGSRDYNMFNGSNSSN